ncbi:MAG: methylated-DNA--[protein]-cysteine S-methyltransferase [Nitrospirota bacterium]|jgi:methylated-DNA-[protein]-cysteine S-methyltransferase
MSFFDYLESPLGTVYMIFSGKSLSAISFVKPRMKRGRAPKDFKRDLAEYFEGRLRQFSQKTVFAEGTEFEKEVWKAIREVPYGETRTYKWLAQRVGSPGGSRAVGQALSKNPIPIVVPCHRIIESTGNIGGYSSGVHIKRRLLEMEYYNSLKAGKTES